MGLRFSAEGSDDALPCENLKSLESITTTGLNTHFFPQSRHTPRVRMVLLHAEAPRTLHDINPNPNP